jgi:cupin fold WbuC family metalloprotein
MKVLSTALLEELAAKASASPRKRAHHNLHDAPADLVQRFFVAANRETYIRPHRHLSRSELVVVMRGRFDIVTFDERGVVTSRFAVGSDVPGLGYEAPHGTWHSVIAQQDGSVFLEVKEGPYDPATAAEFAPWAPVEGDAAVPDFLAWMRAAQPGTAPPGK